MSTVILQSNHDASKIALFASAVNWSVAGSPRVLTTEVPQQILDDAVTEYEAVGFTIEQIRSEAKKLIDNEAERSRLTNITPGDGQASVYLEKSNEAADYIVAGYPADLTTYPFIQAEVNATGKTNEQAADDIVAAKSAWISTAASIEQERLGGKKAVEDASTIAEVSIARDAAVTAIRGL